MSLHTDNSIWWLTLDNIHDRTRKHQHDPSLKRWHCSPYSCHVADSWTSPVRPDLESMVNYSSVHATWIICSNWDNMQRFSSVLTHRHTSQRARIPREYRIADIDLHNQTSFSRISDREKYFDHRIVIIYALLSSNLPTKVSVQHLCTCPKSSRNKLIKAFFVAVPLIDVSSCSSNASHALKYRNRVTFSRLLREIMRFSGSPSLLPSPSVDPMHLRSAHPWLFHLMGHFRLPSLSSFLPSLIRWTSRWTFSTRCHTRASDSSRIRHYIDTKVVNWESRVLRDGEGQYARWESRKCTLADSVVQSNEMFESVRCLHFRQQ